MALHRRTHLCHAGRRRQLQRSVGHSPPPRAGVCGLDAGHPRRRIACCTAGATCRAACSLARPCTRARTCNPTCTRTCTRTCTCTRSGRGADSRCQADFCPGRGLQHPDCGRGREEAPGGGWPSRQHQCGGVWGRPATSRPNRAPSGGGRQRGPRPRETPGL